MPTEYRVVYKSPTGLYLADLEFSSLEYARRLNEVGSLSLIVPRKMYPPDFFVVDGQIEVYRKPEGGASRLHLETTWFIREWERNTDSDGTRTLEIRAHDNLGLLARRVIAYEPGTDYTMKTDYAGNIIKALVFENFCAGAIDANRDASDWLEVAPDLDEGAAMDIELAWQNVLDACKKIAEASESSATRVLFDIVTRQAVTPPFLFKTWDVYRGADHSVTGTSRVIFSEMIGNLTEPKWTASYSEMANFVYAIGEGADATAQNDTLIGVGPFGRIEIAYDSQSEDSDVVQTEADSVLGMLKPKIKFEGKAVDTADLRYGVHFEYGDRVTAQYDGYSFECIVDAVHVKLDSEEGEALELLLKGDVDG